MIVTLTRSQMLQAWRQRAGLEPSGAACSVERFDCTDLDSLIEPHMRAWYLDILARGDSVLLGPPDDVTSLLTLSVAPCGYEATLIPDPSIRRLTSVRLDDWLFGADINEGETIQVKLARQPNRFARPGTIAPLAWRDSAGLVQVLPVRPGSRIVAASGYIDPGPDLYRLAEPALAHIPDVYRLLFQ